MAFEHVACAVVPCGEVGLELDRLRAEVIGKRLGEVSELARSGFKVEGGELHPGRQHIRVEAAVELVLELVADDRAGNLGLVAGDDLVAQRRRLSGPKGRIPLRAAVPGLAQARRMGSAVKHCLPLMRSLHWNRGRLLAIRVEDRLVASGAVSGKPWAVVWSSADVWRPAPGLATKPGVSLSEAAAAKAFPRADFSSLNKLSQDVPAAAFA
jgi:hypothetical protein